MFHHSNSNHNWDNYLVIPWVFETKLYSCNILRFCFSLPPTPLESSPTSLPTQLKVTFLLEKQTTKPMESSLHWPTTPKPAAFFGVWLIYSVPLHWRKPISFSPSSYQLPISSWFWMGLPVHFPFVCWAGISSSLSLCRSCAFGHGLCGFIHVRISPAVPRNCCFLWSHSLLLALKIFLIPLLRMSLGGGVRYRYSN